MIELFLRYEGNGVFKCAHGVDFDEAERNVEIGRLLRAEFRRPRSDRQHRFFFKAVHEAWLNKPESDDRFETPERLRAWLLVKAGHSNMMETDADMIDERFMLFLKRLLGGIDHIFFVPAHDNKVRAYWPKSIEYGAVDQDEFNEIAQRCFDIIVTEVVRGVTVEQLVKGMLERAA